MPKKFSLPKREKEYKVPNVPLFGKPVFNDNLFYYTSMVKSFLLTSLHQLPRYMTDHRKERLEQFLKKVELRKQKEKLFYILSSRLVNKFPGYSHTI
jgi:hypothetical protein